MSTARPRPQKVTFVCIFAGVGSVIVLFSIFSALSAWGSIEVREQIESVLDQPPLDESGLAYADVSSWLRYVLMLMAAVAVSALILAIYTAKGHRGARLGLSILAALSGFAFLAAGLGGLLPAVMAIGCAVVLWSREARDWFDGKEGKESRTKPAYANATAPSRAESATEPAESEQPAPAPSAGAGPARLSDGPGPRPADRPFAQAADGVGDQPGPAAAAPHTPTHADKKLPGPVLAAAIVSGLVGGLFLLMGAAFAGAYLLSPDSLRDLIADEPALGDIERFGVTVDDVARAFMAIGIFGVVLGLAMMVSAAWMTRRSAPARVVLVVLSAVAIVYSVFILPVGVLTLPAAIAIIVLVFRPAAQRWFAPH